MEEVRHHRDTDGWCRRWIREWAREGNWKKTGDEWCRGQEVSDYVLRGMYKEWKAVIWGSCYRDEWCTGAKVNECVGYWTVTGRNGVGAGWWRRTCRMTEGMRGCGYWNVNLKHEDKVKCMSVLNERWGESVAYKWQAEWDGGLRS